MAARRGDDVAPCGAREIGVVEHDPPSPRPELVLQQVGERPQRPSALVAVEPQVPAGDVLLGYPALPGSRDAHDQDDFAVSVRSRLWTSGRGSRLAECTREN